MLKLLSLYLLYYYRSYVYDRIRFLRGSTWILEHFRDIFIQRYSDVGERSIEFSFRNISIKVADKSDLAPLFWETPFLDKFYDMVSRHQVVYDIGGYHAFYSIVAGNFCKEVFCFEMDPDNVERASENISINSLQEKIGVINQPVFDEVRYIEFTAGDESLSRVGEGDLEKEAITLDNFVESHTPPDLIKIDTEGAELRVLEGAENVLEEFKPIIFLEIHDNSVLEDFDTSREDVYNLLERKDYEITSKWRREGDTLLVAEPCLD